MLDSIDLISNSLSASSAKKDPQSPETPMENDVAIPVNVMKIMAV